MADVEIRAEALIHKIKHYLIISSGHTLETAPMEELYQAFCAGLREEVMVNWMATLETFRTKKVRIAHYFSMEYMPGRLTGNNFTNIGAQELVKMVLKKVGRDFSEFISCEPDPGLGNGGLGRLASCFLDSLATLALPARGYGLRYQYGIFEQQMWAGQQVEKPDCWLLNTNPWEVRRDSFATTIQFRGKMIPAKNKHGEDVFLLENPEEVRALPYDIPIVGYAEKGYFNVLPLRLWSTKESPRNFQLQRYNAGLLDQAAENTSLTDVLYPNENHELGKRLRLKQEFLLIAASLDDIIRRHISVYGDLEAFADKTRIQINDTHPALTIAELVRTLTKNHDFTWKEALDATQEICSYTNHTILKEALEEWNELRVKELLPRQHNIIQRINFEFLNRVRAKFPNDEDKVQRLSILENGQVRMAHLAIVGSHKVNGVAKLHSSILKNIVFKDLADLFPEKFTNVTNGVTQRRWLLYANPLLAEFISKRIGRDWIVDFPKIGKLAEYASDRKSQEEFLSIKKANKETLLRFLKTENGLRDSSGKIISQPHLLGTHALFDVQIKRFHEYKRQLLGALHLIMVYQELKANPNSHPIARLTLFGGKAAPGYERAKQIMQLIAAIARKIDSDPTIREKLAVVFIENYNVTKAELIIPAADLSEQISLAGWEASGTGNMKLSMNGALTIGTNDGANIEMRQAVTDRFWPFAFGASAEENRTPYSAWEIYIHDEQIRRAVDALKDGSLSSNASEAAAFAAIHKDLVESGPTSDFYKVLKDLRAYYETQKKVEALFSTPFSWAETAIHNIAAMGIFSTDESIRHYAKEIWNIEPCPLDHALLAKAFAAYAEHDACKIVALKNGS